MISARSSGPKPGALQADDIQTGDLVHARADDKRRQIFSETGSALRDREPADARELVKDAAAAEKDAVLERDMAAEQAVVRDDHLVPDRAVVPDMRAGHEEIVVADRGEGVRARSRDESSRARE